MVVLIWSRLVFPLVVLAVAGAAALGVSLRLVDPLSTDVIPAEDPYTHLALTREHLRDGSLQGLDGTSQPYPPGLHAVLAVSAVHSGVDLADLVRFAPVAFGALAVLGTALALRHLDGNVAAIVGALAVAVTPELIFRSQMMAPTALDLALLPFALLGLVMTVRGRLVWALPTAALLSFLVVSHPWVFGILGLAGSAFVVLALLCPWAQGPRLSASGLALGILLLGGSSALALSGCWGACGPGFDVLEQGGAQRFDEVGAYLLAASAAVAGALALMRRPLQRGLDRMAPLTPVAAALASALLLGVALYAGWRAALGGYPSQVSPRYMMGWPLFAIASAGLAAVPWSRHPGAHAAAAVVAATLPFTLFDPFDSPFWPHRTAAYLALGLALCAGVAAGFGARILAAVAAWSREDQDTQATATQAGQPGFQQGAPKRWARTFVPGLLAATVLGTSLVTAAPAPYPGWYRLFDECEADALRDIAALADADPRLVVVTGDWQAKLVLAATATDAQRIWYGGDLLSNPARPGKLAAYSDDTGHPVLLVVDRHALAARGADTDPSFPHSPAWSDAGSWACATPVTAHLHHPT